MSRKLSIKFGALITEGKTEKNGYLNIEDGLIKSIAAEQDENSEVLDFSEQTVVPGLIDIHTHGFGGIDSMGGTEQEILDWAKNITSTGVTSFLPASVSAPLEKIYSFMDKVSRAAASGLPGVARIIGSRLEGPFISEEMRGAHKLSYLLKPDAGTIREVASQSVKGLKVVDMAPELPGAEAAFSIFKDSGVLVSNGHSAATYETAEASVRKGVRLFTHFYNAMSGFHSRNPGMIETGLLNEKVKIELIADMVHVYPPAIELAVRTRGWPSIVLITDSNSATGMKDGDYLLGDMEVEVSGTRCLIKGTDTIAGSTLTLDRALQNLTALGYSLSDIVGSATWVPADLLGLNDRGRLAPGLKADFCILDSRYSVMSTFVGGEKAFSR